MPSPTSVMTPTSWLKRGTSNFSIFCFSSSVISRLFIAMARPSRCNQFLSEFRESAAHASIGNAVALTDYQPSDDCGVNAQSHRGIGAETLTQEPRYPVLFRLIYVPRADHAHLDPALGGIDQRFELLVDGVDQIGSATEHQQLQEIQ